MRIALDTNILVYAEGMNGPDSRLRARAVIDSLPAGSVCLPVQVLGELFNVLLRKGRRSADESRGATRIWRNTYILLDTNPATIMDAIELVTDHRFAFWDAVIVAAAAEAGCRFLLSEDMHHGFTWRGVTIANPFAADLPPRLGALLRRTA